MTEGLATYLNAMGAEKRLAMAASSRKALRTAWGHRNDRRARLVIRANVTMLRNLASIS